MVQEQLLQRCRNGDRKAQKELYERYSASVYSCCLKYAPNQQEAQDILQDSFITIFEKIEQFEDKGSLEGWCKRIAINTALQRYRKTKVYRLDNDIEIEDQEDETTLIDDHIDLKELLAMIQALPDQYRMVFSLYSLDGYSHREIAELMQISEGTSKSNLSRARQALQQMITRWKISRSSDAS